MEGLTYHVRNYIVILKAIQKNEIAVLSLHYKN